MNEIAPAAAIPWRDRSRALVGWGWVLIVSGILCALLVVLLVLSWAATLALPGSPVPAGPMLLNAGLYLTVAGMLVTLGVGSIRARRWARTLTLIVAWIWLAMGVLMLGSILILPAMFPGSAVPGATCVLVVMAFVATAFVIALPLFLILFYRREDVRRTFEARDPVAGWTERLSPSLLAIVLVLVFSGVLSLLSPLFVRAVPAFGRILTGTPAVLVILGLGAISLVLAAAVWRRSPAGWWGLIALQVVGLANVLTMQSVDMTAYLRESGYAGSSIPTASAAEFLRSPLFYALIVATFLATTGFLIYVRKEFTPSAVPAPPARSSGRRGSL